MSNTDTRRELGQRIRERRIELGLSQDLTPYGGPSDETVRQWERGNITAAPRAKTRHGLERALKWEHGTIAEALGIQELAITDSIDTWHAIPFSLLDELSDKLADADLRIRLRPGADPHTAELIAAANSLAATLVKAASRTH